MGTLTYPNTLTNGTTADADEVMANFDEAKGVINGGIESVNLAASAVAKTNIAADAVDGTKIENNAVGNEHIDTSAADTTEIADLAVTNAKLGADAVDGAKIEDDAVDTEHVADAAIEAAQIASSAVETAKLDADAVTDAKVEYTNASSGVKVQRVGPASTLFGTEGLMMARCQTTVAAGQSGPTSVVIQISGGSTHAIDGDPKFEYESTDLDDYPHLVGWGYYSTGGAAVLNVPLSLAITAFANSGGYITTITVNLDFDTTTSAIGGTLYTTWSGRTDSTT